MLKSDDPILSDALSVRTLTGLSGASVFLMTRDDRHWFVRKAARDAASSDRLRRQVAKQTAFAKVTDQIVRTPRVLDEGVTDGRYWFDMEFVRGMAGVGYLRRATYEEVGRLADRLCAYLEAVAACPPIGSDPTSLFEALYAKLCDVQHRTGGIEGRTLARLFLALDRLRDISDGLTATLCHGDLTLENIIVDEQGGMWLLDFLDAPFEHWWQDVAKLHQDLDGGWYLFGQSHVAQCVLDYLSRRLLQSAARLHAGYLEVHAVLVASTFVRILPYARTAEEVEFVRARIDHFARLAHSDSSGVCP